MRYLFYNVDANGARVNALPTFSLFHGITTDAALSQPTITATAASGVYYFDYQATELVAFEIAISAGSLRGFIDPNDNFGEVMITSSEIKRKRVYFADANVAARNVGAGKPSHIHIEINNDITDLDFSTPDKSYYVVFEYLSTADSAPTIQTIKDVAPTDGTFSTKGFAT